MEFRWLFYQEVGGHSVGLAGVSNIVHIPFYKIDKEQGICLEFGAFSL